MLIPKKTEKRIVMCVFMCFLMALISDVHHTYLLVFFEDLTFIMTTLLIWFLYNSHRSSFLVKNIFIFPSIAFSFLSSLIVTSYSFVSGHNIDILSYVRFAIAWFFCLYMGFSISIDEKGTIINKIIRPIVLLLAFNACYSLVEFATRYNVFSPLMNRPNTVAYSIGLSEYRVAAMFGNPIPYGTILIPAFWLNNYLYRDRLIGKIFGTVIIISLILTRSRSSWLSFAVTFILYLLSNLYQNQKITKRLIFTIFLSCVFLALLWLFVPKVRELTDLIYARFSIAPGSVSANQRLGAIDYVLRETCKSPVLNILFGNGHSASSALMLRTRIIINNFGTTDNQFVTILYDYGLCNFVLLLFFLYKNCKQLFITKNKLMKCIDLSLIGFWANSFFYESLRWTNVCFIAFFLTGIQLSYIYKFKHRLPK